jgi:hypothetical protein
VTTARGVAASHPDPAAGERPDEAGAVAGIEALAFGLLVFVLGTLLVANLWAAVDGRSAADGAARAAARAVVTAGVDSDVQALAHAAATAAFAAHGVPADRTPEVTLAGALVRCGVVEVTVGHRVPLAVLPQLGAHRAAVTVRATHAAVVDPYASGLPVAGGVPCG